MNAKIERPCAQCGATFMAKRCDVKKGNGKFCSKTCYHASTVTQVVKKCLHCGVEMHVYQSQIGRNKTTCSLECRDAIKAAKTFDGERKRCGRCEQWKPVAQYMAARGASKAHELQSYCRECCATADREFKEKNRDHLLAYKRVLYWANPEAAREKARIKNKSPEQRARKNAAAKQYRINNKEKILLWNRVRRMRERAAGKVTPDMIRKLFTLQRGKCVACRHSIKAAYHVDHVVPVLHGGTSDFENLQLLCPSCNLRKHTRDHLEFMRAEGFLL